MTTSPSRSATLPTGFAGSYDDYIDKPLNLHDLLVTRPAATFFFRIAGEALVMQGIYDGDIAVVDRALTPNHLDLILGVIDGEFVAEQWHKPQPSAPTDDSPDDAQNQQEIIGVITSIIRQLRQN